MNKFENALEYKAGTRSSLTQEERLLAEHFPEVTLQKWANAASYAAVKSASAMHEDLPILIALAEATEQRSEFLVRSALFALGKRVTGRGLDVTHPETGFCLRKNAAALRPTGVPVAPPNPAGAAPDTGPEAIMHALSQWDADKIHDEGKRLIGKGGKTARPRAVALLNLAEGLRRNELQPKDLMLTKVPVIPAQFRPTTIMGDQLTLGDANELYRDLMHTRDAYKDLHGEVGDEGTGDDKLRLMDAVRATYGYGEPTNPKTLQRGTTGFLTKITGKGGPKTGWVQQKLLAKPQDTVGRSVITPDADLGMDEISLPKEMGKKIYGPYVQRHLVMSGMSPMDALTHIKNWTTQADHALGQVAKDRPVIYSRAPAWHRFSVVAGRPKFHDGDHIAISPFVTAGLNADFDGDQINIHVPTMQDAIDDANQRLMPSKMLHSIRDFSTVLGAPKHEMVGGLYGAGQRVAKASHVFKTNEEAIKAIESGKRTDGTPVRHDDEVEVQP